MPGSLSHGRLLRYAGLFTWAVVGVPLLYSWLRPADPDFDALPGMAWTGWLSYAAFGASYAWLTRVMGGRRRFVLDLVGLLVLTGSALAVSYYSSSGLGSVLLMVAACVLPWVLPLPSGIGWLVLSQLAVIPVFMRLSFPWMEALMQSVIYAGFSGFVFVTSLVARQQAQARDEQRRLNAELRATRALLSESARVNERTRISRELHDLLGHHLTALSLNLEVAGHLAGGRVLEHVRQAHALARLLLTDVREAVSRLRDSGAIDLAAALRPLAEHVPGLDIRMEIVEPLTLDDPERAHVLLRCTQEIITNTLRHAGAAHLWLRIAREGSLICIDGHDDGRGTEAIVPGHGLRGMRERLAAHGGTLEVRSSAGDGFRLRLCLPAAEAAAPADVAAGGAEPVPVPVPESPA